ncbi:MAG: ATP-dependent RNA helicase DeaD [Syntrophus sp. PtaB.Bin138]|jgi:ATP-dependent RNA helicase DeaD|nr:MAG: ATP-dependent RNA helicase DeaD [Syntrophus sp. PtaB.Bin138]
MEPNLENSEPEFTESKESNLNPDREEPVLEPADTLAEVRLEELSPTMQAAAANAGWTSLMEVQAKAMPYILAGRDLMIQSKTGSGKTGAYLLPILERINPRDAFCQALILVPTRELALQVSKEALLLSGNSGIRTAVAYGGVGYTLQLEAFRGGAQLVIGTPGRILDHLMRGSLSLKRLSILVFDEADRMLSMGFYPDMRRIQEFIPRKINGYLLSATFPAHVLRLAGEFLRKPELLSLSRDSVHVTETEHIYYVVPGMGKERSLVRIIEAENPVSAIIFCNTKSTVHFVSVVLKRFGYDADELSSELTQKAREKVMARIKNGLLRFLVATDVAARGIDIPDLSHVIQYEPPEDPEAYIHRAGRTGRKGASGTAISLVAEMEQFRLRDIAKSFSINLQQRTLPADEEVEGIVSQRVTALLEAKLRMRDCLQVEHMQRFLPLVKTLLQNEDEMALIAMLVDDFYQATLNTPPPQPPELTAAEESEQIDTPPVPTSGEQKKRRRRKPSRSSFRKPPEGGESPEPAEKG